MRDGLPPTMAALNRLFGFKRGLTVASRSQLGLPAWSRTRIRSFRNRVNPNAARLIRLIKLFAASVGPFVACERCHAAI